MRDRRVRAVFVGLILALPILMAWMNRRTSSVREAALPLFLTESILVLGLTTAARERHRLLAEPAVAAPERRPLPSLPHATRAGRRALVK
jgi:hypothetical protein